MAGLKDKIAHYWDHPAAMVREMFGVEPDGWQEEALEAYPRYQRIAMKSAKGPGKTACLAWIGWNYLLTRPHPKCAATSISGANLADNLWTEMAKWRSLNPFLQEHFEWTKTRIFSKAHPETWFMSARSWPQSADAGKQADTLAGLHADYVLFLLDESGSMPDAVMVSADAALSSCKEGHIIQAGNPTQLSGPLYRACTSERRLWYLVQITGDPENPKRSKRISVDWAQQMIERHAGGRSNPWVLVNVLGEFPPSSLNVLIGPDEVEAAMRRMYRDYEIGDAARVMGVDVAREGDDESVIFARQGVQCYPLIKQRNIDSTQGAGIVARKWEDWKADACFIDATGGFGWGWIDQLKLLGKAPVGVQFAGQAHDKARYVNKRAEMYFDAVDWIRRGGALPYDLELLAGLTQTTYTFHGDRLLLEPKDDVKTKLGYSPDETDAFVMTFAEPVMSSRRIVRSSGRKLNQVYRPFADLDRDGVPVDDYRPFRDLGG